jgi:hypothetical protein
MKYEYGNSELFHINQCAATIPPDETSDLFETPFSIRRHFILL